MDVRQYSLHATAVKSVTSGHISFTMVALNLCRNCPLNSGFLVTIVGITEGSCGGGGRGQKKGDQHQ